MAAFLDFAKALSLAVIWFGIMVAFVRDTVPQHTWEWKMMRGGTVALGAVILAGWISQAVAP